MIQYRIVLNVKGNDYATVEDIVKDAGGCFFISDKYNEYLKDWVNETELEDLLGNFLYEEVDDEEVKEWIDDIYYPAIEIAGIKFKASEILYRLDPDAYEQMEIAYIEDELERILEEVEDFDSAYNNWEENEDKSIARYCLRISGDAAYYLQRKEED